LCATSPTRKAANSSTMALLPQWFGKVSHAIRGPSPDQKKHSRELGSFPFTLDNTIPPEHDLITGSQGICSCCRAEQGSLAAELEQFLVDENLRSDKILPSCRSGVSPHSYRAPPAQLPGHASRSSSLLMKYLTVKAAAHAAGDGVKADICIKESRCC
jgi:hypothetical protein